MNILILETRDLSYDSANVFLQEIYHSLVKSGVRVEYCKICDIMREADKLEAYVGKAYDAVIDLNSVLPDVMEDDRRFLDCIDAPFINIIVDHPMHIHPMLNVRLDRYNVVCLDDYHRKYIEKNYPHIKGVLSLPLAGTRAENIVKYEKRKHHILFPGTYIPENYYLQRLRSEHPELEKAALEILDIYMSDDMSFVSEPIHDIFARYDITGAKKVYEARFIDHFIRDYRRIYALEKIVRDGFSVDIIGAGWEKYNGKYRDRLNFYPPCSYRNMLEAIADSHIVINLQPLFTEAPHDRVFNAMINSAVICTDYAEGLNIYQPGEEYLDIAGGKYFFDDIIELKKISENAMTAAETNENWDVRCEKLVNFIKNINIS